MSASVGILFGFGVLGFASASPVAEFNDGQAAGIAGLTAFAAFCSTLLVHAALHAYFGWRFRRGIEALARGEPRQAETLLRVRERRGMGHYDSHDIALSTLQQCRSQLPSDN